MTIEYQTHEQKIMQRWRDRQKQRDRDLLSGAEKPIKPDPEKKPKKKSKRRPSDID